MPFRNSNEKQSSNNVKEEINKKNDERMNDEEFQQFVSIFNERKLSYKHESFHVDDVKRLTGEDRIWASCFFNQKRKSFKNAVDSACKALKWRAERKVADIKQGEIGEELLKSGGMFICGRDKDGSRVFHLVVKKFVRGVAFQDLLVYLLETLQRHECGKSVSFVADCGGARLTSVEMSNIRFVMSALDCYYPNVLKRIYIVDLPWIFNTLWTAVKTWLNEDQRDKVKFIAANKLPKSIPLRHQLNSLDGEKIWSYSCAKLNREENLSLEELPHYDVRVTTIASELKASYSRDKIQGQDDEALTLDEEELSTIPSLSSYRSADYQDRSYFGSCKTSSVDGKDSYIEKECCALVVYADKKCAPIFLNLEMGENRGVDCPGEAQSLNKEEAVAKMDRDFQSEPFNNKSPLVADKDNDSPQKAAEDQPSTASISGKFPSPGVESDEKDESTSVGGLINISPSNVVKFMPQQVNSAAKIWGGGSDDVMVAHLRISTPAHHKSVVTFKIKSNKPDRYFVKPSVGVLRPGKMFDVRILLSSGCDPLREQLSHDRFLVLACKLDDSYYRRQHFAADDTKLIRRLWKKLERGGEYVQHRLRVIQPETTVTVATGDSSSLAYGQQHQMTRGGESGDERKVRREVKRLRVRVGFCLLCLALFAFLFYFCIFHHFFPQPATPAKTYWPTLK